MSDTDAIVGDEDDVISNQQDTATESVGKDDPDSVTRTDETRVVRIASQQDRRYVSNAISTGKYNVFTFLPRFLFEQFRKYSNMFFLVVALLQQIPNVSPTGRFTTVIPLSIILCVSALKEIIEDIKRYRADQRINKARVDVVRHMAHKDGTTSNCDQLCLQNVRWMDVQVGDVVRVTDRHFFPADLILLSSSEPRGMCYIETANLDGETNLKIRQASPRTADLTSIDDLSRFVTVNSVEFECEPPNTQLYKFVGTLVVDAHQEADGPSQGSTHISRLALSSEQLLPRGSMLRNTAWLFGLAVYTGSETKMMLNSTNAPLKRSSVEQQSNSMILFLLGCVAILTVTCAVGQTIWTWTDKNQAAGWYLPPESTVPNFAFMILTSFIMFHTLVPISLQVTLEMVRFLQAYFINWDAQIYDAATDTPAAARTSNLNEELGQVKYIFSDKTGTLTRNTMEYRKCTIAGVIYEGTDVEDMQQHAMVDAELNQLVSLRERPHSSNMHGSYFDDESQRIFRLLHDGTNYSDAKSTHQRAVRDFVMMMAVCHTVVPERGEQDTLRYLASSPDEGALVRAAAAFGYVFATRTPDSVTVEINNHGSVTQSLHFQVLNVIEFTSTRKRMSVIVRMPDGQLRLLLKGADDVVLARLSTAQASPTVAVTTRSHLEQFAETGLRTLCFAMRDLSEAEYAAWSTRFVAASTAISQREERVAKCAELIERDLELLGATAIEDRLQDEVPETIAALLEASIRLWILTGDKQETAVNIGYACRLLDSETSLILLNCSDDNALREALDARTVNEDERPAMSVPEGAHENERESSGYGPSSSTSTHMGVQASKKKRALVIDGATLRFALGEQHRARFLALALDCSAVICCRVSPLQKAEIVHLVRSNVKKAVTLAIGDGANDVGMIQAAHVGVGISGVEGLQAACASDYAIGQFRFLKRLLLVHGAWNYSRMCKLILYSFYKNACMYITQFWFALDNGFSGQILFDSMWIAIYNVVFTSAPPIVLGLFERHCSDKRLLKMPCLYTWSQKSDGFNFRLLLTWLLASIVHSLVIYYLTTSSISHDVLYANGQVGGSIMYTGNYIMTFIIIVVCLKAGLEHTTWNYFSHIAIWGSIASWFILLIVYSNLFPLFFFAAGMNGMDYQLFACPSYWLLLILTPLSALMIDVSVKVIRKTFFGDDLMGQIQDLEALQKSTESTDHVLPRRPVSEMRSRFCCSWNRCCHQILRCARLDNTVQSHTFRALPGDDRVSRGYAFSQEERGAVSQTDYIRQYDSDAAKPSGR